MTKAKLDKRKNSSKFNDKEQSLDRYGFLQSPIKLQNNLKKDKLGEEQRIHSQDIMYMYQNYHNIIEIKQYALRGAKLTCQYGTKVALLDILIDYGVYMKNRPVMTCLDCKLENIHDFGSCMCPESRYKGRLPMNAPVHPDGEVADRAPMNRYPHICVPIINTKAGWYQKGGEVYIGNLGAAVRALLDSAILVCRYGGIISIREVPDLSVENIEEEPKECDRYIVLVNNLNIRENPDKNSASLCVCNAAERINVIRRRKNVEGQGIEVQDNEGRCWVKVDLGEGETGWVADEYILIDRPVIKNDFPQNIKIVIQYGDGSSKTEERILAEAWSTPANRSADAKTNGRYNVAIGPKVMNPKYPDNGKISGDDYLAFSRNITVRLKHKDTGTPLELPCYIYDLKAHSYNKYPDTLYLDADYMNKEYPAINAVATAYQGNGELLPNGIMQTGICYPKASNPDKWAEKHTDGSVIEFFPNRQCVQADMGIDLSDYILMEVEVELQEEP